MDEILVRKRVNTDLLVGRPDGTKVDLSTLRGVVRDIATFEDSTIRNVRTLNRHSNKLATGLTTLSKEVNSALVTISRRISGHQALENQSPLLPPQVEEEPYEQVRETLDVPPPIPSVPSGTGGSSDGGSHSLNVLENVVSRVAQFRDGEESFRSWRKRFEDYLDVVGDKVSLKEQLALLKLNLAGLPREHYDSLKDSEKTSLKATLDGLEAKIDTPQAAEIAKRTLALLRQGPTESVHGFATRLVPLVRASMPGAPEAQIQERMKEALLEKMNDNLHFLVRISGNYDCFDELRMKAQELEMMLKTSKSPPFINALQTPTPASPRTIQENPRRVQFEGQARLVAGQTPPGRFENWAPRDAAPRSTPNTGRRFNPPPRQPTYDRNWRGRSTARCHNCGQLGHFARNCRRRRSPGRTPPPRHAVNAIQPDITGRIEDLRRAVEQVQLGQAQLYAQASARETTSTQEINSLSMTQSHDTKTSQHTEAVGKEPAAAEEPVATARVSSWERGFGPLVSKYHLLVLTLMMLLMPNVAADASPKHPMICRADTHGTLWRLPMIGECPKLNTTLETVPIPQKLSVFRPNMAEFSSQSWVCKKLRKNYRRYTPMIGDQEVEMLSTDHLPMTEEECRQMVEHHTCLLGPMRLVDEIWQTNNTADLTPQWPIVGLTWKKSSSENCYAYPSEVHARFDEGVHSPVGDVRHCHYPDGRCPLPEQAYMVWTPDWRQKCKYIFLKDWAGHRLEDVWVADSEEFALTFSSSSEVVEDCGKMLALTTQGYAVSVESAFTDRNAKSRRTRSTHNRPRDGNPYSSQLAAQLTYLDEEISKSMRFAFTHTLLLMCDRLTTVRQWAAAAAVGNPTQLARVAFNNSGIHAKRVAPDLLIVFPCEEIPPAKYHVKATGLTDQCFEFLPVLIDTESGTELAFVDPITLILTKESRSVPCDQGRRITIEWQGKTMEIDQVTGSMLEVSPRTWKTSADDLSWIKDFKPHDFHNLILTNHSELMHHNYVEGVINQGKMTYTIEKSQYGGIHTTLSSGWKQAKEEMLRELNEFGDRVWHWWATVGLVIVYAWLLLRILMCCLEEHLRQYRLIDNLFGGGHRDSSAPPTITRMDHGPRTLPSIEHGHHLAIDYNPDAHLRKERGRLHATRDRVVSLGLSPTSQGDPLAWPPTLTQYDHLSPPTSPAPRRPNSLPPPAPTVNFLIDQTEGYRQSNVADGTHWKSASASVLRIRGKWQNVERPMLLDTCANISFVTNGLIEGPVAMFPRPKYLPTPAGHRIKFLGTTTDQVEMAGVSKIFEILVTDDKPYGEMILLGTDVLSKFGSLEINFEMGTLRLEEMAKGESVLMLHDNDEPLDLMNIREYTVSSRSSKLAFDDEDLLNANAPLVKFQAKLSTGCSDQCVNVLLDTCSNTSLISHRSEALLLLEKIPPAARCFPRITGRIFDVAGEEADVTKDEYLAKLSLGEYFLTAELRKTWEELPAESDILLGFDTLSQHHLVKIDFDNQRVSLVDVRFEWADSSPGPPTVFMMMSPDSVQTTHVSVEGVYVEAEIRPSTDQLVIGESLARSLRLDGPACVRPVKLLGHEVTPIFTCTPIVHSWSVAVEMKCLVVRDASLRSYTRFEALIQIGGDSIRDIASRYLGSVSRSLQALAPDGLRLAAEACALDDPIVLVVTLDDIWTKETVQNRLTHLSEITQKCPHLRLLVIRFTNYQLWKEAEIDDEKAAALRASIHEVLSLFYELADSSHWESASDVKIVLDMDLTLTTLAPNQQGEVVHRYERRIADLASLFPWTPWTRSRDGEAYPEHYEYRPWLASNVMLVLGVNHELTASRKLDDHAPSRAASGSNGFASDSESSSTCAINVFKSPLVFPARFLGRRCWALIDTSFDKGYVSLELEDGLRFLDQGVVSTQAEITLGEVSRNVTLAIAAATKGNYLLHLGRSILSLFPELKLVQDGDSWVLAGPNHLAIRVENDPEEEYLLDRRQLHEISQCEASGTTDFLGNSLDFQVNTDYLQSVVAKETITRLCLEHAVAKDEVGCFDIGNVKDVTFNEVVRAPLLTPAGSSVTLDWYVVPEEVMKQLTTASLLIGKWSHAKMQCPACNPPSAAICRIEEPLRSQLMTTEELRDDAYTLQYQADEDLESYKRIIDDHTIELHTLKKPVRRFKKFPQPIRSLWDLPPDEETPEITRKGRKAGHLFCGQTRLSYEMDPEVNINLIGPSVANLLDYEWTTVCEDKISILHVTASRIAKIGVMVKLSDEAEKVLEFDVILDPDYDLLTNKQLLLSGNLAELMNKPPPELIDLSEGAGTSGVRQDSVTSSCPSLAPVVRRSHNKGRWSVDLVTEDDSPSLGSCSSHLCNFKTQSRLQTENQQSGGESLSCIVQAMVDGSPVTALIDTGSEVSLLVSPSIPEHKIPCRKLSIWGSFDVIVKVFGEVQGDVQLGENLVSTQLRLASMFQLGSDIQLIIGCDILSKLPPLELDVKKREVTIGRSQLKLLDFKVSGRIVRMFNAYQGSLVAVMVKCGGVSLRALIDTGSQVSLLASRVMEEGPMAVTSPSTRTRRRIVDASGTSVVSSMTVHTDVRIANHEFLHSLCVVSVNFVGFDVILGMDALRKLPRVALDFVGGWAVFGNNRLPLLPIPRWHNLNMLRLQEHFERDVNVRGREMKALVMHDARDCYISEHDAASLWGFFPGIPPLPNVQIKGQTAEMLGARVTVVTESMDNTTFRKALRVYLVVLPDDRMWELFGRPLVLGKPYLDLLNSDVQNYSSETLVRAQHSLAPLRLDEGQTNGMLESAFSRVTNAGNVRELFVPCRAPNRDLFGVSDRRTILRDLQLMADRVRTHHCLELEALIIKLDKTSVQIFEEDEVHTHKFSDGLANIRIAMNECLATVVNANRDDPNCYRRFEFNFEIKLRTSNDPTKAQMDELRWLAICEIEGTWKAIADESKDWCSSLKFVTEMSPHLDAVFNLRFIGTRRGDLLDAEDPSLHEKVFEKFQQAMDLFKDKPVKWEPVSAFESSDGTTWTPKKKRKQHRQCK